MKNKSENAQKPEWMESQEFKDYIGNLKSNQERGFQKKLSQWKDEKTWLEAKYTTLKDYIGRVMADKNAIKYIAEKDPEGAREVVGVLGEKFFQTEWENEQPFKLEIPNLSVNKEAIIQEYEQQKAREGRDTQLNNLFNQFYNEFELTDEERTEFEKNVNDLVAGETDSDRINKLFGYTKSEFTKTHLVDDALASQKGSFNWMWTGMDKPQGSDNKGWENISEDMKNFFDSL